MGLSMGKTISLGGGLAQQNLVTVDANHGYTSLFNQHKNPEI